MTTTIYRAMSELRNDLPEWGVVEILETLDKAKDLICSLSWGDEKFESVDEALSSKWDLDWPLNDLTIGIKLENWGKFWELVYRFYHNLDESQAPLGWDKVETSVE